MDDGGLFFWLIIFGVAILQAVGQKKKKTRGPVGKAPAPPRPGRPPGELAETTRPTGEPAGGGRAEDRTGKPRGSSEGMVPSEVWEEILGLARAHRPSRSPSRSPRRRWRPRRLAFRSPCRPPPFRGGGGPRRRSSDLPSHYPGCPWPCRPRWRRRGKLDGIYGPNSSGAGPPGSFKRPSSCRRFWVRPSAFGKVDRSFFGDEKLDYGVAVPPAPGLARLALPVQIGRLDP